MDWKEGTGIDPQIKNNELVLIVSNIEKKDIETGTRKRKTQVVKYK